MNQMRRDFVIAFSVENKNFVRWTAISPNGLRLDAGGAFDALRSTNVQKMNEEKKLNLLPSAPLAFSRC